MNESKPTEPQKPELMQISFENFEARSNLVSFFDLLLKVDKRNNPERYAQQVVTDEINQ